MQKPFMSLKIINNCNETVKKIGTRKIKRVYHFLQVNNFKNCVFDLCVRYSGDFKNEGIYKTKKDLIHAFKAFTELDLVKEFM